jgi:hypothetical protein
MRRSFCKGETMRQEYSRKNGYTNRIMKLIDSYFFENLYKFLGIHYIIYASEEFKDSDSKDKYINYLYKTLYGDEIPIWNIIYDKYNLSTKEVTFQLKRLVKNYKSIDLNRGHIILSYEYLSFLIGKTVIYRSESGTAKNETVVKSETKTERWKKSVFVSILKRNGFTVTKEDKKVILLSEKDNIEIIIDENMKVEVTNISSNKI